MTQIRKRPDAQATDAQATDAQATDAQPADAQPAAGQCCPGLRDLLSPRLFKALCDPNRIAILIRLAECRSPCSVSQIAACCPINISVVSRHLAMLREAGILAAERHGKEVYYSVRFNLLINTLRAIADAVEACCPQGCTVPGICKTGEEGQDERA